MAILGAFLLASVADASAQTQNANASVTVPTVLSLSVTNLTINFANPTATDFDNGYLDAPVSSVVSTKGNVVHDVTIEADAASFTYTGTGSPTKPAGDLTWSNGGAWTALQFGTPVDVATALSRGVNATAATVDYRLNLSLANDVPGDYSLGFTYTIVAN